MKTKMLSKKIGYWAGVIVIGTVLGLALQFAKAWTEPTVAPPNQNVGAPINTGVGTQFKTGALGIWNTFMTYNDTFLAVGINFSGDSGKVGIGTTDPKAKLHVAGTPGRDGIMFPDGTIQYSAAKSGNSTTNPTCTSFTYSTFGPCMPDGTRTRVILKSLPEGCVGGTPELVQSCTPKYKCEVINSYRQLCTDTNNDPYNLCKPFYFNEEIIEANKKNCDDCEVYTVVDCSGTPGFSGWSGGCTSTCTKHSASALQSCIDSYKAYEKYYSTCKGQITTDPTCTWYSMVGWPGYSSDETKHTEQCTFVLSE